MLKYLFTARFKDGSSIQQDQNDVSATDPQKSQFYDVLERESDLVSFSLHSVESDAYALVNLNTGSFTTHGINAVQEKNDAPQLGADYRIVFFRRHNHNLGRDGGTHRIRYLLGWQTTVNGKNFQRTILFD